jgi:ribosome-associated toxin RatA of RatAB toxin-antitoxin module
MARIARSALVPYSPEDMFDMVAAVEHYPAFLPWCASARVLQQHGDGLDAVIDLRFMGVEQQFATRNRHKRPSRIEIHLLDGPFERLHGEWRFEALSAAGESAVATAGSQVDWATHPAIGSGADSPVVGTRVGLLLDYAMKSGALARLFAPAFNRVAAQLMDAFLARADALHNR